MILPISILSFFRNYFNSIDQLDTWIILLSLLLIPLYKLFLKNDSVENDSVESLQAEPAPNSL